MSLQIDNVISADTGATSTTVTTVAFSTATKNQLLVAFIGSDNATTLTASGAGLTWTTVQSETAQPGGAAIAYAWASSTLSSVTVTGTSNSSGNMTISVVCFTGADSTSGDGSSAIGASTKAGPASGAPSISLTTTRNKSWVLGIVNDSTTAVSPTAPSGQTMIHLYSTISAWIQRLNTTTATKGTISTISNTTPTADPLNIAAIEILPNTSPSFTANNLRPAIFKPGLAR